jgi:hypothetical protein
MMLLTAEIGLDFSSESKSFRLQFDDKPSNPSVYSVPRPTTGCDEDNTLFNDIYISNLVQ